MIIVRYFRLAAIMLLAACWAHASGTNPFTDVNALGKTGSSAPGPTNWRILTLGVCTSSSGPCDGSGNVNVSLTNSQVYDGNVGVSPSGKLILNKSNIVESVYLDGAGNNTQFTNTTSHVYGSMNQTG